jgi:PAS domain S-box-containing protein
VAPTYYAYDRLMHDHVQHGIHFLFAENGPAALRQVSDGQADATILNLAMATAVIARQDLDNLRIATPLPWSPTTLAMASPSPVLASIVQKALDALPEATREAMLARALKQPPPRQHGLPPIGWAVLAVCVLPWPGVLALRWWRRRTAREAQQAAMARELRSQRELMEAVFNATNDAIIVLDDAYNVLMTNRVGAERFGQDVASMLGQGILDLTEKPVAETRRQRYGQALRTGETVRFTDVRAGRTYDNILQPLRIGDGPPPARHLRPGHHRTARHRGGPAGKPGTPGQDFPAHPGGRDPHVPGRRPLPRGQRRLHRHQRLHARRSPGPQFVGTGILDPPP